MSQRLRPLRLVVLGCAAATLVAPALAQQPAPAAPPAAAPKPAQAQPAQAPKDPVVATVNGQPIRLSDLEVA